MDTTEMLRALLENPGTAPFSRIKYLRRYFTPEEVARFFNGLLRQAVACREEGEWEPLLAYLEEWEGEALRRFASRLALTAQQGVPWAPLTRPLEQCRVALVTTGGIYLEGQEPFLPEDDFSIREIPRDTPQERIRVSHRGYDTSGPASDVNCVLPLHRLEDLAAEGAVGEPSPTHYSLMGLIKNTGPLLAETAPDLVRRLRAQGVDAVVLTTT